MKQIESAGIPASHICTVTTISKTVGAVRIVGAVAIPHPTGDPTLPQDKEHELRMNLVKKSLELLKTDF